VVGGSLTLEDRVVSRRLILRGATGLAAVAPLRRRTRYRLSYPWNRLAGVAALKDRSSLDRGLSRC
jgi:hypothetical protein